MRVSTVLLFAFAAAWVLPIVALAEGDSPCAEPTCESPALARPPVYSAEIARNGDFSAEVTIHQPCHCTRHLGFMLAFTAQGARSSHERTLKIDAAPGTNTQRVTLSNAELVKAKITPGHYTLSFGLYEEHGQPAGSTITGQPFSFGSSKESLVAQPVLPAAIASGADLAIPFVFGNDGDIAAKVTALVVFTRPDTQNGIEIYKKDLLVPPRGKQHVVHVSAADRRERQIGDGAWLVTVSAFGGAEQRLASYPGHLLTIGKVLSLPAAPAATVTSQIEQGAELAIEFHLRNDCDYEDLVTALLVFSGPGAQKPIEYKVEGIHVPAGVSQHRIALSATDRYNLGIRPGRWHVAVSALDRAGKRLETRRTNDVVVTEALSTASKSPSQ